MSRFANNPVTRNRQVSGDTRNLAGGEAHRIKDVRVELAMLVLTSLFQPQFYRTQVELLVKLRELIAQAPVLFVAKLAIFARKVHGLRTISHILAGELTRLLSGKPWASRFFQKVVFRPDDMLEIVGYYALLNPRQRKNGKPGFRMIPNAVKKGFNRVLENVSAYALMKYKGADGIRMVDLINMLHPKVAKDHPIHAFVKGELASANTWEVQLSAAGEEEDVNEAKKEVWISLLQTGKLNIFACLRNLRNIATQAPEVVSMACALITNREEVRKSMILPFQFNKALAAVTTMDPVPARNQLIAAVDEAMEYSLENVPKFDGDTVVVLDVSGSMTSGTDPAKTPAMVGSLFAGALVKANKCRLFLFDNSTREAAVNHRQNLSDLVTSIRGQITGGGTNFHSIFDYFLQQRIKTERVIILSDMQGWMGTDSPANEFEKWRSFVGVRPFVYSFDLAGHGTAQLPEEKLFLMAGWSDRVFDIMRLMEHDKDAMLTEIEKVEV